MRAVVGAVLLSGCTLYFGDDPQSPPTGSSEPPVAEPQPPVAELVASAVQDPFDIAVDERFVYWSEQAPDAGGGAVVRWDKATHERVVLATVTAGIPSEIELSAGYVYWTELRGWQSNGRTLGNDRLMRVPVEGGAAEVVAADQWFEDLEATSVAAVDDRVYWLSEGGAFDSDGAIRYTQSIFGVVPVVETLRSGLETPRVIGANATDVCFRTGHPNYDSPIWCAAAGGDTLRTVDAGFPRALTFVGDALYWVDESAASLVRDNGNGRDVVLSVGAAFYVVGLLASGENFFWDEVYETPGNVDLVRMSRPDGAVVTVTSFNNTWISRFAVDAQYVYLVDRTNGRIVRAPRP